MLTVDSHPALDLRALTVELPGSLGEIASSPTLLAGLAANAEVPMASSDTVRLEVRNLLRHGGFKPTGRNKPASEYLIKAEANGYLGPINLVVDLCNVVSLHSGLPISVVDLDRVEGPLRVGLAEPGSSYVFNASDQTIDIAGLLCLHDAQGPCANAVKDSQRTKTHEGTTRCLYLIWGTTALEGRADKAAQWAEALLGGERDDIAVSDARFPGD